MATFNAPPQILGQFATEGELSISENYVSALGLVSLRNQENQELHGNAIKQHHQLVAFK